MEEDFYIPDWRVTKRTKTTRSKARKNYATKMNVKDIKQLVNDQKLEELVVENWAQCDKCNKWRIVKNGDGIYRLILNINWTRNSTRKTFEEEESFMLKYSRKGLRSARR